MVVVGGELMKLCYFYVEMEVLLEKVGLFIYEYLLLEDINILYFEG